MTPHATSLWIVLSSKRVRKGRDGRKWRVTWRQVEGHMEAIKLGGGGGEQV